MRRPYEFTKQKLPSTMGREEVIPVVPPKFIVRNEIEGQCALCWLTSASLLTLGLRFTLFGSARYYLALRSREQLERELQLISVECNFQRRVAAAHLWRLLPVYFPLSMLYMARMLCFIICKNEAMSRL